VARQPKVKAPSPAEKRPSGFVVVLAFAAAIGVTVALIAAALILRNGNDVPQPSTAPPLDVADIPQSGIFLGSPSAKVTLIEYADLQCPFCRVYTETMLPRIVDEYVRPGRVRTEFRGLAFLGDDSVEALRYVQAAGLQDRLWQMQDALYRNQGAENSGWVTEDLARKLGGEIGGLDVDQMLADTEDPQVTARINQAHDQATSVGVQGTPTLFIQIGEQEPYAIDVAGAETLGQALDDALRG
jgi:protein-disulfide isomerase